MSSKLLPGALLAALVAAVAFAACDDKPAEPTPPAKPSAQSTAAVSAPTVGRPAPTTGRPAAGLRWAKPDAWEKVDHPSTMRKATFKIPRVEGDTKDAEMSVTQVGGTVAANIERWAGQFAEPGAAATEEKTVNGLTVTIVEKSGTFRGMMMPGSPGGGETKEWALLGAVVHTKPAHYFKMTGPLKTVKASRADFDKLVASFADRR